MNTKAIPRRYDLVEIMQGHSGPMTADSLAAQLSLSPATIWSYIHLLAKEQLVWKCGKKVVTVHLTTAGAAWTRTAPVEETHVPKYRCGHVKVDSTPFCLRCRNQNRWKEYKFNGPRLYLATMKDGR